MCNSSRKMVTLKAGEGDATLRAPAESSVKKKLFGMFHKCSSIQGCCYCCRLALKSAALQDQSTTCGFGSNITEDTSLQCEREILPWERTGSCHFWVSKASCLWDPKDLSWHHNWICWDHLLLCQKETKYGLGDVLEYIWIYGAKQTSRMEAVRVLWGTEKKRTHKERNFFLKVYHIVCSS